MFVLSLLTLRTAADDFLKVKLLVFHQLNTRLLYVLKSYLPFQEL